MKHLSQNKKWYISNIHGLFNHGVNSFGFFSNLESKSKEKIGVFIDGYVIPRLSVHEKYTGKTQYELIRELYASYKSNMIDYIKGSFIIIIFFENQVEIFSDRHNTKKYFIYRQNNSFLISNSVKLISEKISLEFSPENAALYCLMDHFTGEQTLFSNLNQSLPATYLVFNEEIKCSQYWLPKDLFNRNQKKIRTSEFAINWSSIIKAYIDFLKPVETGITLTGGNDSRMVLAALLRNGIKPKIFTFGNPCSADGYIARKVANALEIDNNIHFVSTPTKDWFSEKSKRIIREGNLLVNIHRAHRLDAIECEKKLNPDLNMVFTGLVGGEYIKGSGNNGQVIPEILHKFKKCKNKNRQIKLISRELENSGIKQDSLNINVIYDHFKKIDEAGKNFSEKQRQFIYTYYYYAVAHHTQDPIMFSLYIPYTVNPFMDIDFLDMLACTKFWFVNNKYSFFKRLWHSYLPVKVTDLLFNKLSDIPYAKKGSYTGKDMLYNPLLYLIKRLTYLINPKHSIFPQNFPMQDWIYQFTQEEIKAIHPHLKELFNIEILNNRLNEIKSQTTEDAWHVITNPINLSLNLKYYLEE